MRERGGTSEGMVSERERGHQRGDGVDGGGAARRRVDVVGPRPVQRHLSNGVMPRVSQNVESSSINSVISNQGRGLHPCLPSLPEALQRIPISSEEGKALKVSQTST